MALCNMKKARLAKEISQEEFAEALGVGQASVSRWEQGTSEPRPAMRQQIASLLGVSVAYLMGDEDAEAETRVEKSLDVPNTSHAVTIKVLPRDFAACCGNGIDWQTAAVDFDYEYTKFDRELMHFRTMIEMTVSGDSMTPDIEDGDSVIFAELAPELERVPNGSIVVANYDERLLVRGLFRKGADVILRAWQRDIYPDILPRPDDYFRVLGIVQRVIKAKRPKQMM